MITIRIGRKRLNIDPIETLAEFTRIELRTRTKDHKPTGPLLDGIAGWLRSLGVASPTATLAWSVWVLVWEYVDRVARQHQANADLAYWYGINPFALDDSQRLALWSNLGRVQAQQQLTSGRFDATDYRGVYKLVLMATGDTEAAERAQADALERYVQAQMARESKSR